MYVDPIKNKREQAEYYFWRYEHEIRCNECDKKKKIRYMNKVTGICKFCDMQKKPHTTPD